MFPKRERKERVRGPRIKYGAGPEWLAAMRSHGIGEFFKIRFLADLWMNIPGCFLRGRFMLRCIFRNRTILGFKGGVWPDLG